MASCLLLGAGVVSAVVGLLFASTYDLHNNLQTTFNLLQPHYNDLAIYTYLLGLESDWCVLELARCVGDDSARRGWQRGNFTHRF